MIKAKYILGRKKERSFLKNLITPTRQDWSKRSPRDGTELDVSQLNVGFLPPGNPNCLSCSNHRLRDPPWAVQVRYPRWQLRWLLGSILMLSLGQAFASWHCQLLSCPGPTLALPLAPAVQSRKPSGRDPEDSPLPSVTEFWFIVFLAAIRRYSRRQFYDDIRSSHETQIKIKQDVNKGLMMCVCVNA